MLNKSSRMIVSRRFIQKSFRSFHHQLSNFEGNSGVSSVDQLTTVIIPQLSKPSNIARLERVQSHQEKLYQRKKEQLEDLMNNKLEDLKNRSEAKLKELKKRLLDKEVREANVVKTPKKPLTPRVQFVKRNYAIVRSELSQNGQLSQGKTKQDVSDNFKKIQHELSNRFNALSSDELLVYEQLYEQDKIRYEAELKDLKDKGFGFKLIEKEGDLFDTSNTDPICIGISADLSTNFGIAKQCLDYFPHIGSLSQLTTQPCILAYDSKHGKEILFLLTKQKKTDKANYNNYKHVLNHARKLLQKNGIERISMPKIGCGGNKLDWNEMKQVIESCFEGTNITITVFYLPQNHHKQTVVNSSSTDNNQSQ